MRRGSKRRREGQVLTKLVSSQIIWKPSFDDPQIGAIEVVAAMRTFVGANYESVSILSKTLEEEKEKKCENAK